MEGKGGVHLQVGLITVDMGNLHPTMEDVVLQMAGDLILTVGVTQVDQGTVHQMTEGDRDHHEGKKDEHLPMVTGSLDPGDLTLMIGTEMDPLGREGGLHLLTDTGMVHHLKTETEVLRLMIGTR